jgi:hypothetical protein
VIRHAMRVQLRAHTSVEQDGRASGQAVEKCATQSERESVLFYLPRGTRVAYHTREGGRSIG